MATKKTSFEVFFILSVLLELVVQGYCPGVFSCSIIIICIYGECIFTVEVYVLSQCTSARAFQ